MRAPASSTALPAPTTPCPRHPEHTAVGTCARCGAFFCEPEALRHDEMSLAAISKHLKVLERAGLISRGRDAQRRPCRLEAAPRKEVSEWAEHFVRVWEERLDRLDERTLRASDSRQSRRVSFSPGRCREQDVHFRHGA
ncbi:MAG TPA: hypothetical protein VEU33_44860 [Archangium sp.]|nr:hypothetical protein [Archangium sp.]